MDLKKFKTEFDTLFRQFGTTGNTPQKGLLAWADSKQLLQYFFTGESFFFSMSHSALDFEFVSDEVMGIMGYEPTEFNAAKVIEITHPDDRPYFLAVGYTLQEFYTQITPDKIPKYKLRYDIRLRKKDGDYIRLLYQAAIAELNEMGIIRTVGTYTDITYLKKEGPPVLSFIGMYGEPSFVDVPFDGRFFHSSDNLTTREKEVLLLLAEGKTSKQIADELNISKETVDKHRKNMLLKKGVQNASELVSKAIKFGWI